MRIDPGAAGIFWSHPSQGGPVDLPEWAVYFAKSGVCLAFHPGPLVGPWFVHVGVNPKAWGLIDQPVRDLLAEFSAEFSPSEVVAWVPSKNRAVIALARRCGFSPMAKTASAELLIWRP